MMNSIRNSSRMMLIAGILLIGAFGCKSKKKAMEASAAAEKARMEQEAATKKQQEEEQRKRDAEAQAKRESDAAAAREREAKASAPSARLDQYFNAISGSGNAASANSSINEALALFASPETPVLIIISGAGDSKDYDRPTTIRDYLNYLKDQKKNANKISDIKFDGSGKITELELRKN